MISGHLQTKGGMIYAVLACKHRDGRKFPKWVPTQLQDKKGNQRAAKNLLDQFRSEYNQYGEKIGGEPVQQAAAAPPKAMAEGDMLFSDFMLSWLSTWETEVDLCTYAGYCHAVEDVIVPYFKEKGITLFELTAADLKEFYRYQRSGAGNGKSKKGTTVVRYHANIHKALEDALADNRIQKNVAHKQRPKTEKYTGNFYLVDEAMELIGHAEGTRLELAVLFGLFYGLRRSEIVGLKWQNFDMVNNTFTIAHSVTQFRYRNKTVTHRKDKAKNQTSMRSLPLIPLFQEKLKALRAQQQEDRRAFADYYLKENQAYVYVNEIGELIKPNYISGMFPKLLKKHSMRHIRFHDLRHSCASLLLKNGVSMKEIQAWLGHSDFGTTANLYAHLEVDASKQMAADRLSSSLLTGLSEAQTQGEFMAPRME